MDTSEPSASTNPRARRRWVFAGAAAVCLLIGVATVVLTNQDEPTSTVDASGTETSAHGWTRLPDPPLRPRVGASAAWTGEEVIVVGGWEFLCPPGADCSGPTEAPFTDGAAFDRTTQTWRPIANSPASFEGEHPAVAGGAVFILVECDVSFMGTDEDPAESRCPNSEKLTVLLRYEPEEDRWDSLPGPPGDERYDIEAVGNSIVAYAGSEERGEQQEWHFDLESAVWTEIPDDPLPLMFDRSIVAADDGRSALLFGADAESGPTSKPGQEVNPVARLDFETMTWTELSSSPSRGYRAWGVDDVVVLEPHFGGNGGLFNPTSSTWAPLPTGSGGAFDSNQVAGAFGLDGAVYVDASGWVFDVNRSEWIEIEPIDERNVFPQSSVTAVGRDLFSFGGERWISSDGEILGDAWLWIAPSAPNSGSTTSPSASNSASTTSSSTSTTSTPTTRAPVATLSDVMYTCGPGDAPVVSMIVAAEEPMSATIAVVVLDEVVGSAPNVDIGTPATTYEVEINLSTDEYEHGEGVVEVRRPDDAVLTSAPVTLRMENGGCG